MLTGDEDNKNQEFLEEAPGVLETESKLENVIITFHHGRLLDHAGELKTLGDKCDNPDDAWLYYGSSIVVAQTAFEVYMTDTVRWILGRLFKSEIVVEELKDVLLGRGVGDKNKAIWSLYSKYTGDGLKQTDLWTAYKDHVKQRNKIGHKGRKETGIEPSDKDAKQSLETIEKLISHIKGFRKGSHGGRIADAEATFIAIKESSTKNNLDRMKKKIKEKKDAIASP